MPRIDTIRIGDALPAVEHTPTMLDLFFYNAAIWNGHRIHYDEAYATQVEGHAGVVVQGPLQGDWMSQCVTSWLGEDGMLTEFEYKNRGSALLGETLTVGGTVTDVDAATGEVAVELFVRNAAGDVLAPGAARVKLD